MKLPIKKAWFDKVLDTSKRFELRDAHLTLIAEETSEMLECNVRDVRRIPEDLSKRFLNPITEEGFREIFDDAHQICFFVDDVKKLPGKYHAKIAPGAVIEIRGKLYKVQLRQDGRAELKRIYRAVRS